MINIKDFIKPNKGKIVFAALLIFIYLFLSLFCTPLTYDNFSQGSANTVYSCGKLIGNVVSLPLVSWIFFPVYIVLIYLISCLLDYLFRKRK